MSGRYKQLKIYQNFKFYPDSPIDILKGAIYIDTITNKTVFQLKFVNIQENNIKAIYIAVVGYDDSGKKLENKEYSYLDLNVKKGVEFGTEQLKELSNNSIRNITVTVNKVIYTDNEIWENNNTVGYEREDLQCVGNDRLFIARRKATEQRLELNNIYYPIQTNNYWNCICGAYNSNNNYNCYKCNCSKELVFDEFSKSKIESDFKEYNKHIQDKKNTKKSILQKLLKVFIILFILSLIIEICIYNIPKVHLTISLDNTLTIEQEQDIKTQIEKICNTTDIQYISKEQALEKMKAKFGNDVLKDYEGNNNIFPSQYVTKVSSMKKTKIVDELMKIKGIEKIVGDDMVRKTIMQLVIYMVLGILLLCIVIVRLRIYLIDRKTSN